MKAVKVFCYRNLHFRDQVMWSVKSCKTNRVLARMPYVILTNVELKVSKAGRLRVLKEKRKNVHAGVKGIPLENLNLFPTDVTWIKVKYNPYKYETFVDDAEQPVLTARYAKLQGDGLWIVK